MENYNPADEIWVAAGTYRPQIPSAWTDSVKNTFYIYQEVLLYGGFNGTETSIDERDLVTNISILSGDLNGDDINSDFEPLNYFRLFITNTVLLPSFTLQNSVSEG